MDFIFKFDKKVHSIDSKLTECDEISPPFDTYHKWNNFEKANSKQIKEEYHKYYKSDYGLSAAIQVIDVY